MEATSYPPTYSILSPDRATHSWWTKSGRRCTLIDRCNSGDNCSWTRDCMKCGYKLNHKESCRKWGASDRICLQMRTDAQTGWRHTYVSADSCGCVFNLISTANKSRDTLYWPSGWGTLTTLDSCRLWGITGLLMDENTRWWWRISSFCMDKKGTRTRSCWKCSTIFDERPEYIVYVWIWESIFWKLTRVMKSRTWVFRLYEVMKMGHFTALDFHLLRLFMGA